jgi:hypothetical protein
LAFYTRLHQNCTFSEVSLLVNFCYPEAIMTQAGADRIVFDSPASYQICVQGQIDPSWSDRLGGMAIFPDKVETGPPATTLVGELSDQAALAGVLNTLYELHLPVLSVKCLSI